ncbi:MAG: 23S rRNA (uracil(1939)-C(5))-methyltransferase RlmD [Oscillospiraceae bacterium]
MVQKNEIVELSIHSISNDGNGVGLYDGLAVFVPYTVVGDRLLVKIVKLKKSYAFGIIDKILEPAPERDEPQCPAYRRCGGCSFRHMSYCAELDAKREIVRAALTRLGGLDIEIRETVPSPCQTEYRNKVQFPVSMHGGNLCVGLYAKRTHDVVDASECNLQPKLLNDIAAYACRILDSQQVCAYNEISHVGLLRHIFLRISGKTGNVMLCVVLNGLRLPKEDVFVEKMTREFNAISSIIVNVNKTRGNVILGETCRTIFGDDFLFDEMCGIPVRLSPLSFFQINTKAAEQLYGLIALLADLKENETLLDLYCGTGTIGLSMAKAKHFRHLIGVEVIPSAIADATENAKALGFDNCEFIADDASGAAVRLAKSNVSIDVAVVDPPRRGCDEECLGALISMSPDRIVMVSCNPATLARDLKYLCAHGYIAKTAIPVDLFPRTQHVECVVLMSRK